MNYLNLAEFYMDKNERAYLFQVLKFPTFICIDLIGLFKKTKNKLNFVS
jgi:hypothetical protein